VQVGASDVENTKSLPGLHYYSTPTISPAENSHLRTGQDNRSRFIRQLRA
jgi:hypothetical protein